METIHALLVVVLVIACFFSYFGGFGTGKCADTEEFAKYAGKISDISVPAQARVIGLGEAIHGNIEFQQLKLEVFKIMVEKYGVRAFALEGDYGGCEVVNQYIHGGSGTAQEAAAAIGFPKVIVILTEAIIPFIPTIRWPRPQKNAVTG